MVHDKNIAFARHMTSNNHNNKMRNVLPAWRIYIRAMRRKVKSSLIFMV
jgi:hypothetical protein